MTGQPCQVHNHPVIERIRKRRDLLENSDEVKGYRCIICGFEGLANRRELSRHLGETHGLSICKKYREKYSYEDVQENSGLREAEGRQQSTSSESQTPKRRMRTDSKDVADTAVKQETVGINDEVGDDNDGDDAEKIFEGPDTPDSENADLVLKTDSDQKPVQEEEPAAPYNNPEVDSQEVESTEGSNDHVHGQSTPLTVLKNYLPDGLKEAPDDSDIIIKAKRQLKVLEGQYGSKSKHQIVPCKCDVCGQNFSTVSQTIVHMCKKYFNMARVLTCSDCGKDFTLEASLDLHRNRIHLKEEPYICPLVGCEYKSASIEGVRGHMNPRESKRDKHPKLTSEERRQIVLDNYKLFR